MEVLRLSRPVVKGVNWAAPKLVSTQTANGGGEGQPLAATNKPDSYCDGGLSNPGTASYMLSGKHGSVMSSMPDRVSAFLTAQRPSRFCDDCIAESLELRRRGDAQKATSVLETTDSFHRALGVCSMCGKEKTVTRRA